MIHIAICDDEEYIIEELSNKIHEILNHQISISKHTTSFSLITYIMDVAKGKVDVIFMDIHLNESNGILVAESIVRKFPTIKIIFMTHSAELAQDIFRIDPIYFLLKPLQEGYLRDALYKTIRVIDEEKADILRIGTGNGKNKIFSIVTKDIYYIESDRRKLLIHSRADSCAVYAKLDDLERELKSNFIRIHQSFIVNMDKIKQVSKTHIILYNEITIPISRSKSKDVIYRINMYMNI